MLKIHPVKEINPNLFTFYTKDTPFCHYNKQHLTEVFTEADFTQPTIEFYYKSNFTLSHEKFLEKYTKNKTIEEVYFLEKYVLLFKQQTRFNDAYNTYRWEIKRAEPSLAECHELAQQHLLGTEKFAAVTELIKFPNETLSSGAKRLPNDLLKKIFNYIFVPLPENIERPLKEEAAKYEKYWTKHHTELVYQIKHGFTLRIALNYFPIDIKHIELRDIITSYQDINEAATQASKLAEKIANFHRYNIEYSKK